MRLDPAQVDDDLAQGCAARCGIEKRFERARVFGGPRTGPGQGEAISAYATDKEPPSCGITDFGSLK